MFARWGILLVGRSAAGAGPGWGAGILPAWSSAAGFPSAFASTWGRACRLHVLPRALFTLLIILASAMHPQSAGAKVSAPKISLVPERLLNCPAKFITCMTWDRLRRAAWIGTEGRGIYEYRPWAGQARRWRHFSKANGLADNSCYAIAVDGKARVWAGTDRHGVDVYVSGRKGWQRYDVLPLIHKGKFGPLGSHPFCISVNPKNGSVWIGTEAGISIYRTKTHAWHYLTVNNGLPSNQINTITFLPRGKVMIGTQCDGIAIGSRNAAQHTGLSRDKLYAAELMGTVQPWHWRVVTGPSHTPPRAFGSGLPSSLINAACFVGKRRIYVGTDSGLVTSRDNGNSWRFEQGQDYAARVLGLFHPPAGFRSPAAGVLNTLLSGEHITCLRTDSQGNLWIGFWRSGFAVLSLNNGQLYQSADDPRYIKADGTNDSGDYVNAILPLPTGKVLIGRYGGGISVINPQDLNEAAGEQAVAKGAKGNSLNAGKRKAAPAWFKRAMARIAARKLVHPRALPVGVKFPAGAAVPTAGQMRAVLRAICSVHRAQRTLMAAPLPDDWRTRGGWIDAVGRDCCVLGAMFHTIDGTGGDMASYTRSSADMYNSYFINPAWNPKDQIRRWVSAYQTADPRAAQNNLNGGRTMSSWDDHGEKYPVADDGPNLYFTMAIRPGRYLLSFYFVNDDARAGGYNRFRDYRLQLRSTPFALKSLPKVGARQVAAIRIFERSPILCSSRVSGFSGGVYKRFFLLIPPGARRRCITLRVDRNNSFNTIMSGIFLDSFRRLPKDTVVKPLVRPRWPFQSYREWRKHPIPPKLLARRFRLWLRGARAQGVSAAQQPVIAHDVSRSLFKQISPRHHLSPQAWTCFDLMEQLMYLRRANPGWFELHGRRTVLSLFRFMYSRSAANAEIAAQLSNRHIALFSHRYVASLMRNFGLNNLSLHVCINRHNTGLFQYQWICRHGPGHHLPANAMGWGNSLFNQWLISEKEKEYPK